MNRLVALFFACAVLAAGCGVSRNDTAAAGDSEADGDTTASTDSGGQDQAPDQEAAPATPSTTAPAGEVAATIEFGDGSSVELLHGETNDIAVPTRENQEFIDLLYQGQVPPGFDSVVLSQRVVRAVMDNELANLDTEVSEADETEAEDLLSQQLVGILATTSADPEGDAARLMEDVPYLPFIVELQARQLALAAALEAGASEESGDPCVSHILVETEPEAQTVLDELAAGSDFATLAATKSIDPSAETNGGDIGCGPVAQYVEEFAEAVSNASLGETVGPVQTQYGFHVLTVSGYGEVNPDALAEAQITEGLRAAAVTIDERVGDWDADLLTIAPAEV